MKTPYLFLAFAAVTALTARGQSPATPMPAPTSANPPVVEAPTAPNQLVYAPRLPTANEITAAAAAQHVAIARMDITAMQVTVIYQTANGGTSTVAYRLLASSDATVPVTTTTAAPRAVVYAPVAPVYYYDDYPPYYWYPPVSLHLGFGYRFGGYHRWR
jgi:hypothetical protein